MYMCSFDESTHHHSIQYPGFKFVYHIQISTSVDGWNARNNMNLLILATDSNLSSYLNKINVLHNIRIFNVRPLARNIYYA